MPSIWGNLYSNPDFQLNLIAEAHGVVVEALLISILVPLVLGVRENLKWRSARVNVAHAICEFHRALFNSTRHVIDPDYKVDIPAHRLPPHFTQEQANYWGKSQAVPFLDPLFERLKKTVEYNNRAFDGVLMSLVSDFLISSEKVLSSTKFFLEAYNPAVPNEHHSLSPREHLFKMHQVYTKVVKLYPEAKLRESKGPDIFSAEQLFELFEVAEKRNPKFRLIRPPS